MIITALTTQIILNDRFPIIFTTSKLDLKKSFIILSMEVLIHL